jgi:Fur family ferric uptake transcriptional regulator
MKANPKSAELAGLRDQIRQAGLRSTQARVAILQRMQTSAGPLTHAQVADDLESRGFDRATIYRCLIEMAEAGLLARMELGDRVWRYELRGASDEEKAAHLHFVCVVCGRIECLEGTSVDAALQPAIKRVANGTISEVLLKGSCRECQA